MSDHQLSMLMQLVDEGVEADDLRVTPEKDEYQVRTPDRTFRCSSPEELEEELEAYDHLVSNWYFWNVEVQNTSSAGRMFLRWLERSDELNVSDRFKRMKQQEMYREWGELAIQVGLNEKGERVYDVSHQSDQENALDELDVHVDPLEARYIAKYDDHGEYRPLKGATTLRSGWVYPGLRYEKLLKTVDFIYPSSIVNWFLERTDQLDVTHYREAADRHTGMFQVIDHIDSDQLETVTARCCTDENCLKRRRWQETAEQEISVDPGNGEIPCREACQVMINEARDVVSSSDSHDHE